MLNGLARRGYQCQQLLLVSERNRLQHAMFTRCSCALWNL